LIYILFLPS